MAAKQVLLDGQVIHGRDRYGWWQVKTLDGWFATPAPKSDSVEVPRGHGNVPTPVWASNRTAIITGRLIATSHQLAAQAKTMLTGLLFSSGDLAVTGSDGVTTKGTAYRGRVTPGPVVGRWLTFEIEVNLPDPFRYGDARSFDVALGSTGQVFHRGTVEAWPNMIVTGDMPSYKVRFRGVDVEVPGGILPGQTHRIEYRTRRLYENNSFVMGGFGATNFRPVDAGIRSDLQLIAPSGSGQVKMTVNDTYL